jgi:hypothetical protein
MNVSLFEKSFNSVTKKVKKIHVKKGLKFFPFKINFKESKIFEIF